MESEVVTDGGIADPWPHASYSRAEASNRKFPVVGSGKAVGPMVGPAGYMKAGTVPCSALCPPGSRRSVARRDAEPGLRWDSEVSCARLTEVLLWGKGI
jgi:hypothetical protein